MPTEKKRKKAEKSSDVTTPKKDKKKVKKNETISTPTNAQPATPSSSKSSKSDTSLPVSSTSPLTFTPPVPPGKPKIVAAKRKAWELITTNRAIDNLFELCYSIPEYQRPYAWEVDNVMELLGDVYNEYNKNETESSYFIGSIVLKAGTRQQVIDGQQRLTSLSILYSALRECIIDKEKYQEQNDTITGVYLKIHKGALKGQARIEVCNDEQGVAGKDKTFFKKYIVEENGFSNMLQKAGVNKDDFDKDNVDEIISNLEEAKEITSTSAMNSAKNFLHAILKIKKVFKKQEDMVDFIHFLSHNCIVVTITVPEHANELAIFGTLNLRGKDLSPMDKLKLDFGRLFGCVNQQKNQEMVDSWNHMYQEIGEDFANILENIHQLQHPQKNVKAREYLELLDQIASQMKETVNIENLGETFMNNYMNPIFIGHQSKSSSNRPVFSTDTDKNNLINKMISRTLHIAENYLPKAQRVASNIILATLIAIAYCKEHGQQFLTYNVSVNVKEADLLKLIAIWHNHVLLVCLCDFAKVKFFYMINEILNMLKDKPIDFKELTTVLTKTKNKKKDKKTSKKNTKSEEESKYSQWNKKILRQANNDSSAPSKKKQTAGLKKVFSTILPIIEDYLADPNATSFDLKFPFASNLKLCTIVKKDANCYFQIGNFTLCGKSFTKDCSDETRFKYLKKESLQINVEVENLNKLSDYDETICKSRTTRIVDQLEEILKQLEKKLN